MNLKILIRPLTTLCITSSILFTGLFSANIATASPIKEIPDRGYQNVVLPFRDTHSPQAKLMIQALDSFYQKKVAGGFNGSVLVGYKGQILYERYLGVANRATGLPLSRSTASQLASTSKPFTAVAVLWLAQQGYLKLDAEVNTILKDFPYEGITVRMLLNHRSGLQNYTSMGLNYWRRNDKIMYNEDLLQMYKKHKPRLRRTPGTKFEYCNTNYAFLARIVEEVSQMSFARFMKTFIFEPLGMKNTFVYDPLDNMPTNRAISYKANWAIDGDMFADGVYGDKGIYSTVQDMYKWDQSFYQHILLKPSMLQQSYQAYSPDMGTNRNYGLGWRMLNSQSDNKIIFHNGWWHGNNTVFYRFIKDNFTIIVLGNRYNKGIYGHVKPIYDIVKRHEQLTTVGGIEDLE